MAKRGIDSIISKKSRIDKDLMLVPASIWKRILAFLIDLLVVEAVILTPFKPLFEKIISDDITFASAASFFETHPEVLNQVSWITAMISMLILIYFSVLQFKMRQTLGMMLFGLWIYGDGQGLTYWRILVSNLTFIPVFPFIMLWVIDPLFMLFSGSGQRFMQKISEVYVVEEAQVGYTE